MELDINWIEKYEKEESTYKEFYKDDIKYIKIYSLLINNNKFLENIHEENIILEEQNKLTKPHLISLINKFKNSNINSNINNNGNNNKIKLLSILKYNIDLDSDNIFKYLKQDTNTSMFLTSLNSIDDIIFEPTITLFEDLNSLFIVYNEEDEQENDSNNRHSNKSHSNKSHSNMQQTKRIILHSNHKKTKKMKYHKV